MKGDVPLIIPEVNSKHLQLIPVQKENNKWDGFIVTNPNCTTTQLVLALKPLHDAFSVTKVTVTSMQALSGAGYDGVSSLDIIDNIIPYIEDEERKIEEETPKLLGDFEENGIIKAEIAISAHCNRVNVSDGHLECVSVSFDEETDIGSLKDALSNFASEPQALNLYSAPKHPVMVMEELDRPQPRLDKNMENGMASIVGRIREDPILDFKFLILGHNTIRGAAGCAVLNAELLVAKKYL
jgi:aspartate-semialdehyde dehydrogenase